MVYVTKTPEILRPLARDLLWKVNTSEKALYLTFDDGPTPGVTEEVLDLLKKFGAKATFFCIGGNAARNPELYQRIIAEGHMVGNHTYNHMNGWKFSDFSYYKNILECQEIVHSSLFRPPYGRIKRSQVKGLKKRYQVVMWDVLSADFDTSLSPEKCIDNVISGASEGSIVVFHDSDKAKARAIPALEAVLTHFAHLGYIFRALAAESN